MSFKRHCGVVLGILMFTIAGFLVMGYHPGAEDDAVYLAAVKADLNPSLFPHDAAFFQLQMRTSLFDTWMAHFVRTTGMPLPWAELSWHLFSIFLFLVACYSIIRQLFPEESARWGGIALVTAMFTLPVAGTALFIVDQYLHPRCPATACILFAVSLILAGRRWQAVPLLVLSFFLHPLMGALGISFSGILVMTLSDTLRDQVRQVLASLTPQEVTPVAMLIPFGWVFDAPSPNWLYAFRRGHAFRLYTWTWFEWIGAIAPVLLLWLVVQIAYRRGERKLSLFAAAACVYAVFQLALAMLVESPSAPIALSTLEPMRYLHLIYIFLALIGGAYLGRGLLRTKVWRWAAFLLIANGGMFLAQRDLFASTLHLELPNRARINPWVQSFDWIRDNTPKDAYFALGSSYMSAPGEDHHSFRAIAERSQLSDSVKDTSMVTKVPELATEWREQVAAQEGWDHFQLADFERLRSGFGVTWVVVQYPAPSGLSCPWHNGQLSVCRIP